LIGSESGVWRLAAQRELLKRKPKSPPVDRLVKLANTSSNPGVRVESISILKDGADILNVRTALLNSLAHDPNPGVRLKALEGLKAWAGNASVRRSLGEVLLKDDSPQVRIQAIDLLTAHRDDSIVGVLQHVVQQEDNDYVRTRTTKLLEEMGASVGTY
jgi:HEAT repeat protein